MKFFLKNYYSILLLLNINDLYVAITKNSACVRACVCDSDLNYYPDFYISIIMFFVANNFDVR